MRIAFGIMMLLAGWSAQAGPTMHCGLEFLRDLIQPLHHGLATAEDRILIQKWFSDPSISSGDASMRTFGLVLGRRLDILPDQVRNELVPSLTKAINERKWLVNPNAVNGRYSKLSNEIEVENPKALFHTVVEYHTLIHEGEHGIQHYTFGSKQPKEFFQSHSNRYRFEQEYGAMLTEWNYLNAVPKSEREKMILEIERSSLGREQKDMVTRQLRNADLEATEYLEQEWMHGRYHPDDFDGEPASFSQIVGKKTDIAIKVGIGLSVYYLGCSHWKDSSSSFYRNVCRPVFGLPAQRNRSQVH